MKTNYSIKAILMFAIIALSFTNLKAQANVRISKVDPATNSVTLKNYGDATATISGYWFCVVPAYSQVSGMTSVTTLAPDEEVDIASTVNLVASSGEFGLYSASGFSNANNMLDFLQWGTGSSGSSRESVAVAAGLWVADTFITVSPPYQYNGDGTQNGVANWSTLGVDDFEEGSSLRLYPNPTSDVLNIEFKSVIADGTLEVFDILGKQVFVQSITSNNISQIDVTNWESGLYLIKMSSENGEETKRFIKQ
ncbi:T9SS type A sorting domain-containing protein [Winogradskyella ouciana]|uniref:T9SS type A sorting domain-containing protein n=1 Tax=Winogradskyella ouciana TaxID=2608631 RepID=A0A7K1GAJ0_9FLAO|nr:T9SS type A sorting domain-containing protein [Winogradskyella ouciana]MTE26163.1 T9SS type A sorting domain-containing protein [Winogradskyella ouciana]